MIRVFPSFGDLKQFMNKLENIYQCETCGKSFAIRDNLKKHIKFVHGNVNLLKCDTFDKRFRDK